MGWQDRDWARLDEGELHQLYGVVPAKTGGVRVGVWAAVVLLVLAVGGFAYTQMPARDVQSSPPAQEQTVLYGVRGTDASVDALAPGGTRTVCTEEAFVAAAQRWSCLAWAVNTNDLPVVLPQQYQGQCTHLVAAVDQARWTCLGNEPVSSS